MESREAGHELRPTASLIALASLLISTLLVSFVPFIGLSILVMFLWLALGPYFVGDGIAHLLLLAFGSRRNLIPNEAPGIAHFVILWLIGTLILFTASTIAWSLGVFSFGLLLGVTVFLVLVSAVRHVAEAWRNPEALTAGIRLLLRRPSAGFALALVSAGVFMAFLRAFSPPPYQFGWDVFLHSYIVNQIRDLSIFHPLPSGFSNAVFVDAYTTSFYLPMAVASFLGRGDVLLLFWIGPLFNLVVYALGILYLANKVGAVLPVALVAVAFGMAFHEWTKAFALVYLAPAALITAMTPVVLGLHLGRTDGRKFTTTDLPSLPLALLHFFAGGVLLVVAYGLRLARRALQYEAPKHKTVSLILISMFALLVLVLFGGWAVLNSLVEGPLDFLVSRGTLFGRVNYNWKIATLSEAWYTLPLVGSALAGLLAVELRSLTLKRPKRHSLRLSYLSFLMLGGLIIFSILLEQTARVLFLVKPGLIFLAAILALELSRFLPSHWRGPAIAALAGLVLLSAMSPALVFMNRQRWEGDTNGLATSFIDYEAEMGIWIRTNLESDIILLSDPRTQDLMLPFAMRESLFGAAMPLEDQEILRQALLTGDAMEASAYLAGLLASRGYVPETAFLIVSGRTIHFANDNVSQVFRPRLIDDYSFLERLRPPYFVLQHSVQNNIFLYSLGGT